ncbi:MAG: hypothetical protein ABEJ85_01400, partial [Haloarculaceae archaeon]
MADESDLSMAGYDAYLQGLRVIFALYVILILWRLSQAMNAAGQVLSPGPYGRDPSGTVLVVLFVALVAASVLALFLSVFMFVSLHNA